MPYTSQHEQFRRPSPLAAPYPNPAAIAQNDLRGHRRQHSQGFFEPSLPSANSSSYFSQEPGTPTTATLTASQIAAQAAMQHQNQNAVSASAAAAAAASFAHIRKRSQTVPNSQDPVAPPLQNRKASKSDQGNIPQTRSGMTSPTSMGPPQLPLQMPRKGSAQTQNLGVGGTTSPGGFTGSGYQNGVPGGQFAAAAAANVAFPRSITPNAPGMISSAGSERGGTSGQDSVPEKETKKGSKMKLFSKPKSIGISKDKEKAWDRREQPLPSPSKSYVASASSGLSKMMSASSNNLNDPIMPSNVSLYSLNNGSSATILPVPEKAAEKEKKHHFLSRQKLKLKDKDDHFNLPLSSASSNSKPLDPSAPQSLYSFAPSSPGPSTTTFGKSVSGLDLRHGGRALRDKKREEKTAHDPMMRESEFDKLEWPGAGTFGATTPGASSTTSGPGDAAMRETLQGFGLNNMTPDDAWDFLKAKLLAVFQGGEVHIPVEDLNKLVSIHLQRALQKSSPWAVVDDLRELLRTGFMSLDQTLRNIPDERLVPNLVQLWLFVFGTNLPYMQAVFLPLDLLFKKANSPLSVRQARELRGATPSSNAGDDDAPIGDELDVRSIALICFRDEIILPRFEILKATFSRLSLDTIHAPMHSPPDAGSNSGNSSGLIRPSTATSNDRTFNPGSYNSQSSNMLSDASGSRSRATSNTSAPDSATLAFHSFATQAQASQNPNFPSFSATANLSSTSSTADSSQIVTDTVARMLQCLSVLGSVNTGDESQSRIETLNKELKLNWLGRGRTGRNRRGFVGTRVRNVVPDEKLVTALQSVAVDGDGNGGGGYV